MATIRFDARGLKCPMPTLQLTNILFEHELKSGDTLVVLANCPTFEKDLKAWCKQCKKVLISVADIGDSAKQARVRI
jgi:tRNA 2-thiouridine synthesizing protein A